MQDLSLTACTRVCEPKRRGRGAQERYCSSSLAAIYAAWAERGASRCGWGLPGQLLRSWGAPAMRARCRPARVAKAHLTFLQLVGCGKHSHSHSQSKSELVRCYVRGHHATTNECMLVYVSTIACMYIYVGRHARPYVHVHDETTQELAHSRYKASRSDARVQSASTRRLNSTAQHRAARCAVRIRTLSIYAIYI